MVFEGVTLVVPQLHPGTNMAMYSTLGKIISHAYLMCGILPIQIAFLCLKNMLIPHSDEVTPEILINSFVDSTNHHESKILKDALTLSKETKEFTSHLASELSYVLSCYGCRQKSNPNALCCVLHQIACCQFNIKPAAALTAINAEIPPVHKKFWEKMGTKQFYTLYLGLSPSATKVLQLIDENCADIPAQEQVHQ